MTHLQNNLYWRAIKTTLIRRSSSRETTSINSAHILISFFAPSPWSTECWSWCPISPSVHSRWLRPSSSPYRCSRQPSPSRSYCSSGHVACPSHLHWSECPIDRPNRVHSRPVSRILPFSCLYRPLSDTERSEETNAYTNSIKRSQETLRHTLQCDCNRTQTYRTTVPNFWKLHKASTDTTPPLTTTDLKRQMLVTIQRIALKNRRVVLCSAIESKHREVPQMTEPKLRNYGSVRSTRAIRAKTKFLTHYPLEIHQI